MKHRLKLSAIILLFVLTGFLLPCAAQQKTTNRQIGRFADGYLLFDFTGKTLTRFEFHRTNSERNFCDIEASRNSNDSRWKEEGDLIRITLGSHTGTDFKSNGDVLITKKGGGFEITFEISDTSLICGLGRQLPSRVEVDKIRRRLKVKVIE